jgi:sialate O-acetylesterase
MPKEPANEGQAAGWARPDFNDSDWRTMSLPAMWQWHGEAGNGTMWFRKRVDLPADWAGRPLQLQLGPVDDFDTTYVNGVRVGGLGLETADAYQLPRSYSVPAELTARGNLVLAIRVFDFYGDGGFSGGPREMRLELDSSRAPIPISGEWRYRWETRIGVISPDTQRNRPVNPAPADEQNRAAALFHAMIHPLVPYGLRGVVWYQGESNSGGAHVYDERLIAMIQDWRARWATNLSFYQVQLAGYEKGGGWPAMWDAQLAVVNALPGTNVAHAFDLGDRNDVHPLDKKSVGQRLARIARARDYGEAILYEGPRLAALQLEGDAYRIELTQALGLATKDRTAPSGFEWHLEDGSRIVAQARIEGDAILIKAPIQGSAKALSYAYEPFPGTANVVNEAGLPLYPFRRSLESAH